MIVRHCIVINPEDDIVGESSLHVDIITGEVVCRRDTMATCVDVSLVERLKSDLHAAELTQRAGAPL